MAIIWKEKMNVRGKQITASVYKTDKNEVTEKEQKKADELDALLAEEIKKIEAEMKSDGLIKLKGKHGVLKFWYELGKRLLPIVTNNKLIDPREKKFLWRAIYDKAPELFSSDTSQLPSERIERFIWTAIFISRLPWKDLESTIWTQWVDAIADQRVIREDERIQDWLIAKIKKHAPVAKQDFTRSLLKAIHDRIGKRETQFLSDKELEAELEKCF